MPISDLCLHYSPFDCYQVFSLFRNHEELAQRAASVARCWPDF